MHLRVLLAFADGMPPSSDTQSFHAKSGRGEALMRPKQHKLEPRHPSFMALAFMQCVCIGIPETPALPPAHGSKVWMRARVCPPAAYLFNACINTSAAPAEERLMTTGLHQVAELSCRRCSLILGWRYVSAGGAGWGARASHTCGSQALRG